MYHKTVIEYKLTKYSKAPEDFTVSASPGIKHWICRTCDHGLKWGKLPAQEKANKRLLHYVYIERTGYVLYRALAK